MKRRYLKVLSFALALIMTLSLCPPVAFAAPGQGDWWGWGNWWDANNGPEMPAQQFEGKDTEDGVSVTVDAPEGALPQGTEMVVTPVRLDAAQTAVDSAAGVSGTVVAAVDITFFYEGTEIEPEKNVSVTLASDAIANAVNPTVLHLDCSAEEIESGNVPVEVMSAGSDADSVSFSSDDFSVYVVTEGTGSSIHLLTVKFYNEDGSEIISSQSIRLDQLEDYIANDMDYVHDPGVPSITATQSFEGWAKNVPYTEDDHGYSVDEINEEIKSQREMLKNSDKDIEWKYYAKVYDVVFVTFHDQDGVVIRLESIHLTDGKGEFDLNLSYTPAKGGWAHVGWTRVINNTGNEPTYPDNPVVYENGDTIPLTESIDLYPYLKQGYWLVFDNYIDQDNDDTSASFTSPMYFGKDETVSEPTYGDTNNDGTAEPDEKPYRVGYTFGGWYTDKDWKTEFQWGQKLTEETTVYAKWIPNDASYLVVYMIQKETDEYDQDVTNNTYRYYASVRRDWTWASGSSRTSKSGDRVSAFTATSEAVNDTTLAAGDLTESRLYNKTIASLGQYFEYSSNNNDYSVMVDGDGSTVLYVYYDRKPVTISFYEPQYELRTAEEVLDHLGDQYYYQVNQKYYQFSYSRTLDDDGYITECYWYGSPYSYAYVYTRDSQYSSSYSWKWYRAADTDTDWTRISAPDNVFYYVYNNKPLGQPKGLYGATIDPNDTPDLPDGYQWAYNDDLNSYTPTPTTYAVNASYQGDPFDYKLYLMASKESSNEKTLHYISQDPETGEWQSWYDTQINDIYGLYQLDREGHRYIGCNLTRDSRETSRGFIAAPTDGDPYTIWYSFSDSSSQAKDPTHNGAITGDEGYTYYELTQNQLVFRSKSGVVKEDTLRYGQSLERFGHVGNDLSNAEYVPTDGGAGYFFDGWYTDESYLIPFDFDTTMPDRAVTLYAKWTKMRFRVVLDYSGGDSDAQVEFPANQASTFRVDYGEKVRETAIAAATRDGYTLLGWYLDPEGEHPFNFGEAITDKTFNLDRTYVYGTGRTGTDPVNGDKPYTDDDVDSNGVPLHADVIGKVTIYALWRKNSVGSDGVRIRYDAIENDGYFAPQTDPRVVIRDDPNVYTNQAKAFTQVASTPEDQDNYRFLYWVVMQPVLDANGDNVLNEDGTPKLEPTTVKVYPGQTFTVDYDYTVRTEAVKVKWEYNNPSGEPITDATTVTKGNVPQHSKPSGYVSDNLYYPVIGWEDGTKTYYYDGKNHTGSNVDLPAVTENATFTAVYGKGEELANYKFTVTWQNSDGTVLETKEYTAGETPSYTGATPTREADADYTYTFSGWTDGTTEYAADATLPVVSGDVTYTARYDAVTRTYDIVFHANGGTFSGGADTYTTTVNKGTLFKNVFPTSPTNSTTSWYFLGWYTAVSGGESISSSKEVDGTVTELYAHWYVRKAVVDTSGTFIVGDCYAFRSTYNSTYYYMTSATAGEKLTGTSGSSIPGTAQWVPRTSNTSGSYILENYTNAGTYIYDYSGDTDYLACSTSKYALTLEVASSSSGTYYLYTSSTSGTTKWYVYFDGTNYQWSKTNKTAFTVLHIYNEDQNAVNSSGTSDSVYAVADDRAATSEAVRYPSAERMKPAAPAATKGNTTPVKATTEKYEKVTGTELEVGAKYLITDTVDDTTYVMTTAYYDTSNNYRPRPEVVTVSNNQITGDYSGYAFTVGGSSSGYTFQNSAGLLGANSSAYVIYGATNTTWAFNANGYLYNTSVSGNYKFLRCNNGGQYFDCFTDGKVLTFYKLVEDGSGSGDDEPTTSDLDKALNVEGGTLHFESTGDYPWTVSSNGTYAQSSNNGVNNSNSTLTMQQIYMNVGDTLSFYYVVGGEITNNTIYDYLYFSVNGTQDTNFGTNGRAANVTSSAEQYTFTATTAGNYTFTWVYTKDGSTHGTTDFARITDVEYTTTTPSYTITWNYEDENGVHATAITQVKEGDTPVKPDTIPATYTENGVTYTLTGWTPEIEEASETSVTTYTAVYEESAYEITWTYRNENGELITDTTTVDKGSTPVEPENIPQTYTKDGVTWAFNGWEPTVVAANGVTTYAAQYTASSYTITWKYKNASGQEDTKTTEVTPGEIPAPGFTPASYTVNGEEYRFTGWDKEIVAATEPATYTAQYTSKTYTITWHYQTDGDDNWTEVTMKVAEGVVPSYNTHPVWEDGDGREWMFSGWSTSKNGEIAAPVAAYADADYWAQYTEVGVYTYTMYLHAVYGPYNKSGTHITWFGNNDPTGATSGVSVERDKGLKINFGYDIPTPTTFFNGTKDHADDANQATSHLNATPTGLTYDDHVFLGWARVPSDPTDTAGKGQAHPELGEDDLYLKWTGSGYLTKSTDGTWVSANKVAADEMTPYHDMYAVWAKVFYVYHSGTGTVERRVISTTTATTYNQDGSVSARKDKTFDLTANLPDGSLYGGYYSNYDGKSAESGKALFASETAATVAELNAVTPVTRTDTGATTYTADNLATVKWIWNDAYSTDLAVTQPGNAIIPQAGETYYIKEVPANLYLQHYTHYTYKLGNDSSASYVTAMFLVSNIDDANYNEAGCVIETASNEAKVVKSLKITTKTTQQTVILTPGDLFGTSGYLSYVALHDDAIKNINALLNYWVTPDGLLVTGTTVRGIMDVSNPEAIRADDKGVDSTIGQYSPVHP